MASPQSRIVRAIDPGVSIGRYREALRTSIQGAIASLNAKQRLVLITADIRGFREINIRYGLDTGDEILRLVGERLLAVLRPEDVLFRTGDDEFSIMLCPIIHPDHALLAVNKIQQLFRRPVAIADQEYGVGLTMGIAICADAYTSAEPMIRQSLFALNHARQHGQSYVFYDPDLESTDVNASLITKEIESALFGGEVSLVYQPIFSASDRGIVGIEGLARWTHDSEVIKPDQFIPVMEHSGQIKQFTHWVFNTALRECAGLRNLFVAINVSAINLADDEFPELVKRSLSTWRVDAQRVVLEVTETSVMRDVNRTRSVLQRLSELGVALAIDDFGSGYSSLKYIRELPVTYLKIDGEFIERLDQDSDKRIVDAVSKLGHSFGLNVVAEGVSSAENCRLATELGCDLLQGNFLAAPAPISELGRLPHD